MRDFTGVHVGFWGFGIEGLAAYRRAAPTARVVSIVAQNEFTVPAEPPVTIAYTGSVLSALLDCDLVFVSPGIPRSHPFLSELAAAGIAAVAGSDLWLRDNHARTIGVTGTKGKSTTASLIHAVLRAAGSPAVLAGNIGTALLDIAAGPDPVVAELSSYQCAWITNAPAISVVTNLYSEHLPWHGTQTDYWRDKARIIGADTQVLVCDSATLAKLRQVADLKPDLTVALVDDDSAVINTPAGPLPLAPSELPGLLRAPHNAHNARCALTAASFAMDIAAGGPLAGLLATYEGLPHRLQTVAQTGAITWISDTLSTAPESVIAAAESFPGADPLILIVGGQSRGVSYAGLNEYLCKRASIIQVIAIPGNGAEATAAFAAEHPDRRHTAQDLDAAVRISRQLAAAGGTVVLSPGAPSFDYYRNYADKTARFTEAIARAADPAPSR